MNSADAIKRVRNRFHKFHISVNVFLGIVTGLFLLLLSFGAFTQTAWFKNYLREVIEEQVNSSIHGRISIGEIGGTLFTSFYIKDLTLLSAEKDTVVSFRALGLKYSPHALLKRTIVVRTVYLDHAKINLIADSNGVYNISKILPPSEKDTASSQFLFRLDIKNVSVAALNFVIADYNKVKSTANYNSMDLSDFRISDLNLNLSAMIDIRKKLYDVTVRDFRFSPNLTFFNLNQLKGDFKVDKDKISVSGLTVNTNLSDLSLDASINKFNIFKDFSLKELNAAPLSVDLTANRFNFDDLTSFISSTDMLKGEVSGVIRGEGTLDELSVNEISLKYLDSRLNITGYLQNVTKFDKFYINAKASNSKIYMKDVIALLPVYGIPEVTGFEDADFDTLTFDGHPLNFITSYKVRTPSGLLEGGSKFNFMPEVSEYQVSLGLKNLNITRLTKYPVEFTGDIEVEGKGFSPKTAEISATMRGDQLVLGRKRFNNLLIDAELSDQALRAGLYTGAAGPDTLSFLAELNLQSPDNPFYSFVLDAGSFNLNGLIPDTVLYTNLNLHIEGEGQSLDPEKLNAYLKVTLNKSNFYDKPITDTKANLSIRASEAGNKNVTLISNIGDIEISGKFNYVDIINAIIEEQGHIAGYIDSTVSKYLPGNKPVKDLVTAEPIVSPSASAVNQPVSDMRFSIKVKDLTPFASFTDNTKFDLDGEVSGRIRNDSSAFRINLDFNFDFFSAENKNIVTFGDKSTLGISYKREKNIKGPAHPEMLFDADVNRFHINGNDVNGSRAELKFEKGRIFIDAKADYNNIADFGLKTNIDATGPYLTAEIEKITGGYKGFSMMNKNTINLSYRDQNFYIKNCELVRGNSSLKIDGYISEKGSQDLNITASNFKGYDISYNLIGLPASEVIDYDLNAAGRVNGSFTAPLINLLIGVDSLTYKETNFGTLKGFVDYSAEKILTDLRFIDKNATFDSARFNIAGILPLNLSLGRVSERLPGDKPLSVKVVSKDFDLKSLVNTVPFVRNLRGYLTSDIAVSGSYNNMIRSGSVVLRDAFFTLEQNALDYSASASLDLTKDELRINEVVLKNAGVVKNSGTMRGTGKIVFKDLSNTTVDLRLNGNLTVLAAESRSAIPEMYGDLFLETNGDVVFSSDKGNSALVLPLKVIQANLKFPPAQSAYSSASSNYLYRFITREIVKTARDQEIEKLLSRKQESTDTSNTAGKAASNLDVIVNVQIRNEASVDFIFSEEANQRLNAKLSGDINFSRVKGIQSLQGELKLLENSTLEFIKTFTATGSIRFETEVTNPNLDISAEYKDYYAPTDSLGTVKETEVAVRMKLMGPLNDLYKNFSQLEDNILVYYGTANIRNDKASTEYDKADAVWFILTSKFKKDLTSQEKTNTMNTITGMGTSVAGSLLGSLIKNYLGEYVSNIEIRSLGTATKFNLSGRFKKMKYTVGGSTNVLQDFSAANIRIEYPIIENFIFRVERKEAVTNTDDPSEMINEVAIKYRFEF